MSSTWRFAFWVVACFLAPSETTWGICCCVRAHSTHKRGPETISLVQYAPKKSVMLLAARPSPTIERLVVAPFDSAPKKWAEQAAAICIVRARDSACTRSSLVAPSRQQLKSREIKCRWRPASLQAKASLIAGGGQPHCRWSCRSRPTPAKL